MEKKKKEKKETNSSYFVIRLDQYNWLRRQSYERHMSMSAIVREALDLLIKKTPEVKDTQFVRE